MNGCEKLAAKREESRRGVGWKRSEGEITESWGRDRKAYGKKKDKERVLREGRRGIEK